MEIGIDNDWVLLLCGLALPALLAIFAIAHWNGVARRRTPADGVARRRWLVWLAFGTGTVNAGTGTARSNEAAGQPLVRVRLHNIQKSHMQAAGFVSPMFGLSVRQGDIPAGQHPQFTLSDGRPCPVTLWGITSWPDGSLKFCGAMVRVPADIPARDVLDLLVRPVTAAPVASQRSLEELAGSGLAVELTGVAGLEGVWTAELAQGIRERTAVVQIGNGEAGAIWRIGTEFRDGAGKAHGQLYCWHYVAALQNADGGLLGLRYLGRVAQPWTDVATPAPRHRDLQARVLAGSTVLRTLQGHVDDEKPGNTIRLPHYASLFTAGEDARWDYVQASGTAPTDGAVRISLDPVYLTRTQLVPPYDLKTYVRPVDDVNHHPMGRGTVLRAMGTTGERVDIGVLPEWCVRHLISQDPSHERVVRVNAMISAGWRLTMRKRSTGQPVPCVDIAPRYAGLGAAETLWRGYAYTTGMVKPAPNDSLWREDTAHRPGCVYWPYLFTGEPQYLDLMVEQAFAHVLDLPPGINTYATRSPIRELYEGGWRGGRTVRIGAEGKSHPGAGVLFNGGGGLRIAAWSSRDVAQAAGLCPDTPPDGAAVRGYLRDVMNEAYAALADYAQQMPANFTDAGMLVLAKFNESPWMRAYMSWSICHQADVLATPAATGARQYLSRLWSAYAGVADIGGMTAYRCSFWTDTALVEHIEDVVSMRQGLLSFVAMTSRGTIVNERGKPELAWKPTNGDVFVFGGAEISPLLPSPEIKAGQRLHAINCEGQTFQLSRTPGGEPIQIPSDVDIPSYMCRARNLEPAFRYPGTPSNYQANVRGAVAYHLLRGDDVAQAKQALDRIVDGQRIKFDDQGKYLVAPR